MKPEEIKNLRVSLGLKQADFARLFDSHVMTINKWEKGNAFPTPYQIGLMQQFKKTAELKSKDAKSELSNLIVSAGIIAALVWLLTSAK